jgi:hypothetical protein
MKTDGNWVTACSSGLDALTRLAASLRRLDWASIEEARQVPGATYADKVRQLPVHDAILSRGYPIFRRQPVADILRTNLKEITYPPLNGSPGSVEAYAEMLRRVDSITGTAGLGHL